MTYTDKVQLIEDSFDAVKAEGTGTFISGRRPDATLLSNAATEPMCILFPIRIKTDRSKRIEESDIVLMLLVKDDLNNDWDTRNGLIDDMEAMMEDLLSEIETKLDTPTYTYFAKAKIKGEVLCTPEIQIMGKAYTGYSSKFILTSKLINC